MNQSDPAHKRCGRSGLAALPKLLGSRKGRSMLPYGVHLPYRATLWAVHQPRMPRAKASSACPNYEPSRFQIQFFGMV
jgi:hypothetical protein